MTWLSRAFHLLELGYPELAAGDAYKSNLLIMNGSFHCETSADESIELKLRLESLTLLAEALVALVDHVGLHEVCREGLAICPSHPGLKQYSEKAANILKMKRETVARSRAFDRETQKLFVAQGRLLHEQYPFMSTEHMNRDKKAIDAVKNALNIVSSNCSLAPRAFSNPSLSQAESFGIYATANIGTNTRLFDDETILGATDTDTSNSSATKGLEICENCCGSLPPNSTSRVKSTCCSTVYCSEHCHKKASTFYHSKTCGRDFKWLFEGLQGINENDPAMNGPMFLRILSICTQSDCHPLDHPLIARLIPKLIAYSCNLWTFRNNIVIPNKILQQLGVDIFQDLRFDTWALQSVLTRLLANQHFHTTGSRRRLRAVNSLFSFLNHSCEPNARWPVTQTSEGATAFDSTTVSIFSTKPIKKGEEICIDYLSVSRIREKAKRQEMLGNWIPGGVCACPRCQREV